MTVLFNACLFFVKFFYIFLCILCLRCLCFFFLTSLCASNATKLFLRFSYVGGRVWSASKGSSGNDGLYLSIVDAEDALAESGSSFLAHRSLRRPKATQV